jgi:hypothetical protein
MNRALKFRYQPGNLYIQYRTVHRDQRPSLEPQTNNNILGSGNISSVFRNIQSRWR